MTSYLRIAALIVAASAQCDPGMYGVTVEHVGECYVDAGDSTVVVTVRNEIYDGQRYREELCTHTQSFEAIVPGLNFTYLETMHEREEHFYANQCDGVQQPDSLPLPPQITTTVIPIHVPNSTGIIPWIRDAAGVAARLVGATKIIPVIGQYTAIAEEVLDFVHDVLPQQAETFSDETQAVTYPTADGHVTIGKIAQAAVLHDPDYDNYKNTTYETFIKPYRANDDRYRRRGDGIVQNLNMQLDYGDYPDLSRQLPDHLRVNYPTGDENFSYSLIVFTIRCVYRETNQLYRLTASPFPLMHNCEPKWGVLDVTDDLVMIQQTRFGHRHKLYSLIKPQQITRLNGTLSIVEASPQFTADDKSSDCTILALTSPEDLPKMCADITIVPSATVHRLNFDVPMNENCIVYRNTDTETSSNDITPACDVYSHKHLATTNSKFTAPPHSIVKWPSVCGCTYFMGDMPLSPAAGAFCKTDATDKPNGSIELAVEWTTLKGDTISITLFVKEYAMVVVLILLVILIVIVVWNMYGKKFKCSGKETTASSPRYIC